MKPKYFLCGMALVAVLSPATTLAISSNNQGAGAANSQASQAQDTDSKGQIRNCNQVEAKIQTRLEKYSSNKEMYSSAYQNFLDRLDRFNANIKAKGYDTSVLEADIATLEQKINEFNALTKDSYAQLQQTQQYTCGQSQGSFAQSLLRSRQQIRLAHQKAQEIRTFYATVIKPDLKELKDATPGVVSNSSSEQTGTDIDNANEN